MKFFIILIFIAISCDASYIKLSFEHWEAKFSKKLDASRRAFYRQNYNANLQDINDHNNRNNQTYKKGLNEYSHLPRDQFINTRCKTILPSDIWNFVDNKIEVPAQDDAKINSSSVALTNPPLNYPFYSFTSETVPEAVDWSGLMQPIRNQASCGACWAFATMGLVEGVLRIRNRTLPDYTLLSPQFLIDCDKAELGCQGGWPTAALRFLKSAANGNVAPKTADYPYQSERMICNRMVTMMPLNLSKVSEKYLNGNETALQVQVANYGPTIVAMYSTRNLAAYNSGVFNDDACPTGTLSCSVINHAVIVVGYGTDPLLGDYWKIKNSFGISWGEDGYLRIARNNENMCNIACWAINAW